MYLWGPGVQFGSPVDRLFGSKICFTGHNLFNDFSDFHFDGLGMDFARTWRGFCDRFGITFQKVWLGENACLVYTGSMFSRVLPSENRLKIR